MSSLAVLDFSAADQTSRHGTYALGLLAGVAQHATSRQGFASLPMQFAKSIADLGGYLWIRGEAHIERYFAEAIALACLQPATTEVRGYELMLTAFAHLDRRHPMLPRADQVLPLMLIEQHCIHFIELLRTQSSFQALYDAAVQIESYGAMDRSPRKSDRLILLSRELSGQPLLARVTPHEEMYLRVLRA